MESSLTLVLGECFFLLLFSDTPAVKELKAIINSALSEQVQQVLAEGCNLLLTLKLLFDVRTGRMRLFSASRFSALR